MTNIHRMVERHQAANLLALQATLRVSGLLGIGMLSAVRKTLDTYLICLQRGAGSLQPASATHPPGPWMVIWSDTMTECVEKSWQDFRNQLQIALLTQDEALIWAVRIDRALTTE